MYRVGEWVGAGLWANRESHPDNWGRPFTGQVLDCADYRAWANTFDFPEACPDLGKVMSLVLRRKAEGLLNDKVPVEWHFDGRMRVIRWQRIEILRSSKEDLALWKALRAQRLDELNHPRRRTKRPLTDFLADGFMHLAPAH